MSCLYEMGDWESLYEITETLWNDEKKQWNVQNERKKEIILNIFLLCGSL